MNPEITNNSSQTNLNSTQVVETPKKCKHLPIIIILAILAVAGIGFGGFELWQNICKNEENEKIKLELVSAQNNNEKLVEYATRLADKTEKLMNKIENRNKQNIDIESEEQEIRVTIEDLRNRIITVTKESEGEIVEKWNDAKGEIVEKWNDANDLLEECMHNHGVADIEKDYLEMTDAEQDNYLKATNICLEEFNENLQR